jgi:hypothetical protein
MQTIRTSCPLCGRDPVDLMAEEVTVTENKISPEWSTFSFRCPECHEEVTKPANFEVLALFAMARGVRWNVVRIPAEMDERHYVGPPLTEGEVSDFIIELGLTPAHLISLMAEADK